MNIPTTFDNLRTRAEFDDWPFGRQRCRCIFWIETGKRGERCCRVTENKTRTGWNNAKKLTFAARMVIADGDDGKTYVLALGGYGGVYVHFPQSGGSSNMQRLQFAKADQVAVLDSATLALTPRPGRIAGSVGADGEAVRWRARADRAIARRALDVGS